MKFIDIFDSYSIEEYKKDYKMIEIAISNISNSVAYLIIQLEYSETQEYKKLSNDVRFAEKLIYDDMLKSAVLKFYRYYFELNGSDVMTLAKFKNKILKEIKSQYKEKLRISISKTMWRNKNNKIKFDRLIEALEKYRNKYLAHNIPEGVIDEEIKVEDLVLIHKAALELFSLLKFDDCSGEIYIEELKQFEYNNDVNREYLNLIDYFRERIKHLMS
ncbi:hypothetical protein [Anaerorhabdus furcosa]|uniref:HEPN AbiU2-like domain-containing protein n=1 Tax=Anaerorhabdus furcosa TaxID=118967 RepID=A0A1T4M2K5_9FIRM|nr:hypothetical protein [Anaerorhabdus furcosa]SJZ61193.1 hypothetical protein SAMN02745191_1156 [Anaerorhabdus furcosa]